MRTADFDYELPDHAIAQSAIEPRDAARLLVVPGLTDHAFRELPDLLQPGDLLVVNQTRVRAARLRGTKPDTGGSIEALLTRRVDAARWEALMRPARRLRPGTLLEFGPITGTVLSLPDHGVITLSLTSDHGDVEDVLPAAGEVPLPPYFRGTLADSERYQTMFAKRVGSAAAPTAALHFTPRLVAALRERGITIAEVELEVGLDTFRPMQDGDVADHVMHTEHYRIADAAQEAIEACRRAGGRVVAVGTTTVRTLESAADGAGGVRSEEGKTGLFITPGYRARVVDAVITNFHAPRTTLIAMIAALVGPQWRDAYAAALDRGYRFLSFGDAMLIEQVRQ